MSPGLAENGATMATSMYVVVPCDQDTRGISLSKVLDRLAYLVGTISTTDSMLQRASPFDKRALLGSHDCFESNST